MMSKIKSRKIANVKVLVGIVLAACLVAGFAFDQNVTVAQNPQPATQSKTIIVDGKKVQLSGDAAGIEKLFKAITESDNFDLKANKATGEVTLMPKMNVVGEVAVTGLADPKAEPSKNDDEVYLVVDEMPEYPGGSMALRTLLAQSIKYPLDAVKKGIQGKVYVNFVVEKDGTVGLVKIARGVDPSLDAEAMRVVKLLTNWKPGKQKGKDVRVSYTVPIQFALE